MTIISSSTDVANYMRSCIKTGLTLPELDVWENQPYYVEVWIEEDGLVELIANVTWKRQVPLYPAKDQVSSTRIEEAKRRFEEKTAGGKKGIILYAGDLNPSGWDIYQNIGKKLEGDQNIELKRFALNSDMFNF